MITSNITINEKFGIIPLDSTGVGLKPQHYKDITAIKPDIEFIEIHPESFFTGGMDLLMLEKLKEAYNVSFHSISLSLASPQRVPKAQLKKLKELIDRVEPIFVSGHASWSISGNAHSHDVLAYPYNTQFLENLCNNILEVQDFFSRQIMIENPSTHHSFNQEMSEAEFLTRAVEKTGCKILLDVNNIFVNSVNHKFDPREYIDLISANIVDEIHLSGNSSGDPNNPSFLFDTHDDYVCDGVWNLYGYTISEKGPIPTLIEWDSKLPPFSELVNEVNRCKDILDNFQIRNAA